MSKSQHVLFLDFPKVQVKIKTNYKPYFAYMRSYFEDIIVTHERRGKESLLINAFWKTAPRWVRYLADIRKSSDMTGIGASTFMCKNRIVSCRKMAKMKKGIFDFSLDGRDIVYTVSVLRKAVKDTLRYKILQFPEERIFFEITYPIIYYPLFWYLEYSRNIHMLHASAIAGRKNIVICGLEGVGKSSLTMGLLGDESRFLSDNIIFYDERTVYPCHELVRLSKKDNISAWEGKIRKIEVFKTAKQFFRPVFGSSQKGMHPDILIFPEFSSRFFVREISPQEAVKKGILLSQLPSELGNYLEYANLYNLLDVRFDPWSCRYRSLELLLKGVRCLEIGMPRKDGLARNIERARSVISDA